MFTEADRVQIRRFLGYSAIYIQADPRLENAISASQSIADGGTRPDNSSEVQVKSLVTDLLAIETQLKSFWQVSIASRADDAIVTPFQAMIQMRQEGWRLVNNLSVMLNTAPKMNVFSGAKMSQFSDNHPASTSNFANGDSSYITKL